MFLLLRLSLRNLLRQKRRNLLLGSAMAIGIMLLVVANSFSHGLSDIVLNKVLRWVTGHVTVAFNERGHMTSQVFRDKDLLDFIQKDFKGVVLKSNESIGTMVRAIGNGAAENMILVGTDFSGRGRGQATQEEKETFQLVEGNWDELRNTKVENPVVISAEKARTLNVKRRDILRVRLRNIYGQNQSVHLTVMGTMKTSNMFMGPVTFGEMQKVKAILGYDEHSTGNLNLVIKNPEKNARALADAIHARLQVLSGKVAVICGTAEVSGVKRTVTVLGFNSDPALKSSWGKQFDLVSGDLEKCRLEKKALVAQPLAQALGLHVGSVFTVHYTDKWGTPQAVISGEVGAVFRPGATWGPNVILQQDERFYEAFYSRWPEAATRVPGAFIPAKNHPAYALLSPEWVLLPRTSTTDELEKKMKSMGQKKWHSTVVDVRTMYETAEQILKLEGVLNMITLVAVLVLFFIILIGVINTLRMTIRERTREIGTIRAIGMQRTDVRNIFMLETLLLAFFASVAGVLLALGAMGVLSHIPMHLEDNPMGMFLVSGRLYFIPTLGGVIGDMVLIWVLAGVTAYFPARRAANLSPGAALRHFE
jgi:ABC-type lipoprotein release transport system permease subunit